MCSRRRQQPTNQQTNNNHTYLHRHRTMDIETTMMMMMKLVPPTIRNFVSMMPWCCRKHQIGRKKKKRVVLVSIDGGWIEGWRVDGVRRSACVCAMRFERVVGSK
jgi:hypothetical protein